jgi:hypothetical protein
LGQWKRVLCEEASIRSPSNRFLFKGKPSKNRKFLACGRLWL